MARSIKSLLPVANELAARKGSLAMVRFVLVSWNLPGTFKHDWMHKKLLTALQPRSLGGFKQPKKEGFADPLFRGKRRGPPELPSWKRTKMTKLTWVNEKLLEAHGQTSGKK